MLRGLSVSVEDASVGSSIDQRSRSRDRSFRFRTLILPLLTITGLIGVGAELAMHSSNKDHRLT